MVWRPRWRLPLKNHKSRPVAQSEAFKKARALYGTAPGSLTPRCQRFLAHYGRTCRDLAIRGSRFCKRHGGWPDAVKMEALRYTKPITRIKRPRKKALGLRGLTEPWPEGLPKLDRFLKLGVMQKGRLFEAWENRLTDPDSWQRELDMPRYTAGEK